MGKNLEIKVKVESLKSYEDILIREGLKEADVLIQTDTYYEVDEGLMKLRLENGRGTLIRYNRDETEGADRWSDYSLTDVNPVKQKAYYDSRYKIWAVVPKVRTLYMYKNTRIHLDRVEGLGKFIELESVVTGDEQQAKDEFNYMFELLGLAALEEIKGSYSNLISGKK